MFKLPVRHLIFLALSSCLSFLHAATWDGSDAGHPEWSSAANWVSSTVPANNSALTFPSTAAQKNNTNNLTAGTIFGPIVIDGSDYNLNGNRIILKGGISLTGTAATGTINFPVTVSTTQLITVQDYSSILTMTGQLNGTGGITKNGEGTLVLVESPKNTGAFRIEKGTLEVRGAIPSAVQIGDGYLSGTGSVNGIQSLNTPHAAISPGIGAAQAIGTLTSKGNVTLWNTDAFFINLGSDEVDKLVVKGTCNLGGAHLSFSHLGGLYGLAPETDYVIIDNDGTDIVQLDADMGTWLIRNFQVDSMNYQLSRVNGSDNNDLTIRRVFGTIPTTYVSVTPWPQSKAGEIVSFEATVKAMKGFPMGNVAFYDGFTKIGEAPIDSKTGLATFNTNALLSGNRQITAVYDGSNNYSRSQSSTFNYSVVGGITTTTSLTIQLEGEKAILSAQVTAAAKTATGTVDFFDGTTWLGKVTLNESAFAQLTSPNLVAGEHNFSAVYATQSDYFGSSDSELFTLAGTPTTLVLSSSLNPAPVGSTFTITATVIGGTPTGTIEWYADAGNILVAYARSELVSGKVTMTFPADTIGKHTYIAAYEGSFTHQPSDKTTFTQIIKEASSESSGGSTSSGSTSSNGRCGIGSGIATIFLSFLLLMLVRLREN
jgi:autotransporter-associated beta strand protein